LAHFFAIRASIGVVGSVSAPIRTFLYYIQY
jgi:hypothetical protein